MSTTAQTKSVSRYLVENWMNFFGIALMIVLFVQYFVQGGIPQIMDVNNAFSYSATWVSIVGVILASRAFYMDMQRKEKWWWHNIIFFVGIILGVGMWAYSTSIYYQVYFYVGLTGVSCLMALGFGAFVIGMFSKFKVNSTINAWLLFWIILGFLPYTYFLDLAPQLNDVGTFMWTVLYASPYTVCMYTIYVGAIAIFFRAVLLIEKIRPRGGTM